MNIRFRRLQVTTTRTVETIDFGAQVTFLHGPIGAGKSSVARLIDYCFGGRLERTPAIQLHFVSARLDVELGSAAAQLERSSKDRDNVRVSWEGPHAGRGSLNAPLNAGPTPILGDNVYNLSDLIFWLVGVEPIKVRRSQREADSPLVRLSIRDLFWYCYLKQDKLDGSFFRLEDTFKKYKSMDAMRFVTGLYSERLSELEAVLARALDEQRAKRASVEQIRKFLTQFDLGSEIDLAAQAATARSELDVAMIERETLDRERAAATHVVEPLREKLRNLSAEVGAAQASLADLQQRIRDQESLRSELITAKVKASRSAGASSMLGGVDFARCPRCGSTVEPRADDTLDCYLCHTPTGSQPHSAQDFEVLQRDLNARIDDLTDSLDRHKRELDKGQRASARLLVRKTAMDAELTSELARYDSAFIAAARAADRKVAALQERIAFLDRLAKLPAAIQGLEREAGSLQGEIDTLRSAHTRERQRLKQADNNIEALEERFLEVMRTVGFPGVSQSDTVSIDPRNWEPKVVHGPDGHVVWGFFDAGSGGKKTLFNVCYAVALHEVAQERGLPLPTFLIVDSPSKNFGRDINRPLAVAMFQRTYAIASPQRAGVQLVVIDSDFVAPADRSIQVLDRLMAPGDLDHPPLISYYSGP